MEYMYESQNCKAKIKNVNNDVTVSGIIKDLKNKKIKYVAATPPDYRATFSGSGLPFQNQLQAFDNTPNVGEITLDHNNQFIIKLMMPNSYAVGLGSVIVPPTLFLIYDDKTISIKLSEGIPYRHLTYPIQRSGVEFYATQFNLFPIAQDKQLILSRYPQTNNQASDYFGYRPPL
jgi:hypothetical protein